MPVAGEIMLFGVRLVVDSMRKTVSMNNLSQYHHQSSSTSPRHHHDAAPSYASADDAAALPLNSSARHHRKRGIPWSEEEHKMFLVGLERVGKGDWRGISRNYVKTRTPTQVASHAQKHFLRQSNHLNRRRRRRSSLFDITTPPPHTVSASPVEEDKSPEHQDNVSHSHPVFPAATISVQLGSPMEEKLTLGQQGNVEHHGPVVPDPRAPAVVAPDIIAAGGSSSGVDPPPTLSLGLSLSSSGQRQTTSTRHSNLHAMLCFNNGGDSIISVA